jgi:hypothetical protein
VEWIIIVGVLGWLWWRANKRFELFGRWADRRRRSAFLWAIAGAIVGSFFGIAAGPLGAMAGTIPGAFVGYLLASNMMKREFDDEPRPQARSSTEPTPNAQGVGRPVAMSNTKVSAPPAPIAPRTPPPMPTANAYPQTAPVQLAVEWKPKSQVSKRNYPLIAVATIAVLAVGLVFSLSDRSEPVATSLPPPLAPSLTQNSTPSAGVQPTPTKAYPASQASTHKPVAPKSGSNDVRSCLQLSSSEAVARCVGR